MGEVQRRLRTFAIVWTTCCFVLGAAASWQLLELRAAADAIERAGSGLDGTGETLRQLEELPVVGDEVAEAAGQIESGGASVRATASSLRRDLAVLAVLVGAAMALLPTIPVLALTWVLRPGSSPPA